MAWSCITSDLTILDTSRVPGGNMKQANGGKHILTLSIVLT